jgi:antitoxin FitA
MKRAARRRCTDIFYAEYMPKVIQLRDVSEQMHSTLKARAAREGMSLSGFIKRELERTVERPTMREWLERTQKAKPIPAKQTAAQIVRKLRETR